MFENYIKAINCSTVYDVAVSTPLEIANKLSARLNNHIYLKREDMQPIFSFKIRGAYNKISQLSPSLKSKGVIAASAGNHAQGVALSAKACGIEALIVMPVTTPQIKVDAVKNLRASIILKGDSYDDAYQHAISLAKKTDMIFIPPYDDPDVIAGQGTIGKEITEQCSELPYAIFIPVGGGGLIAGISAWIKHKYPDTLIIGVEPEDTPTLHDAMQYNERVTLKKVGLFTDGVAVRQIGKHTFDIARHAVDDCILVSIDEICAAIKDNFDENRSLLEPAGALAIAGMKKYISREKITNKRLIAINSGSNINFDRLKHIVERYEVGEGSESLLAVTILEKPGSFLNFCRTLGKNTITEFNYRYSGKDKAQVFVGLQVNKDDKNDMIQKLCDSDHTVFDLSNNEMAKIHMRHMIGGHLNNELENEHLCRFQFPERPGALLEFLEYLAEPGWNISLFHYRNHGSAYGRVLVGIQIPDTDMSHFESLMAKTKYNYCNETGNPAYRIFLR